MRVHAGEDVVNEKEHSSIAGGSESCKTALEISMVVSQENGNQSTSRCSNNAIRHITKGYNKDIYLFSDVHCSTICNSQKLEAA